MLVQIAYAGVLFYQAFSKSDTLRRPLGQWRSQNRIVARAQVGHIYNAAQHAKVSVGKHTLLGGLGACPPGKFWSLGPPRSHLLCFQAR